MVRVHRWFDIYCTAYQIWCNTIDMHLSKTCKGKPMKNELIDLLDDAMSDWDDLVRECQENGEVPPDSFVEHIADYLLANGVAFGKDDNVPVKWISTKERFPTEEDAGRKKYIIVHEVSGLVRPAYFEVVRWHPEEFTHWMPSMSTDGLG